VNVVLLGVGEVENGYHRANSYHNAVHATDVTQAMNCYINEQKVCVWLSLVGGYFLAWLFYSL